MRLTVAQFLIRFLKERGARYVFGVSGHSVFDITDAIYLEPGIDFVPAQIELSAAYMADGYARATRRLGVCLGSSGAGATNLVTGIAQAHKESSPVIAIAADVEIGYSGKGASSWHEVPQAEIFQPITKMSVTIKSSDDVVDVLNEAVRRATTGRKGPVYVGIPEDLQREEIEVDALPPDRPAVGAPVDPALIRQAAEELRRSAAPTIVAGGGVYWAEAEDELRKLAELLRAPFGTSHSHKGLISEDHPLSLGVLGFGSFPYANKACQESDVILAVGCTFSEGLTLGYGNEVIPRHARMIQIDIDPAEIGKSYPVHLGIVGDAKQALSALVAELTTSADVRVGRPERMERIAAEKSAWRDELTQRGTATEGPINQWHLYHALRSVLPPDAVVVGEGGTRELLARFIASCRVHHSGDFRAIGHGISTAVAINYAFPQKSVVCVSGDGSFMMEMQELATAMRSRSRLVLIVVHNDAYGNMKRDQIRQYEGRIIGTELYVPDLCTLAASFGMDAERVEQPGELADALARALAAGKPYLLDVVCPIEGI